MGVLSTVFHTLRPGTAVVLLALSGCVGSSLTQSGGETTTGLAAVLVEQDLHLAFRLADEVAVMQKGRIVHRSPTADFRADRARAHALLGVG
ncbi:hypothetical protein ACQEVF_02705 [Nonomuraea polychroma]|uniref:hypothetical protein n=1 Tax=Nonomuraea polychroma TaxID=46176 RepID=UPI003D8AB7FC